MNQKSQTRKLHTINLVVEVIGDSSFAELVAKVAEDLLQKELFFKITLASKPGNEMVKIGETTVKSKSPPSRPTTEPPVQAEIELEGGWRKATFDIRTWLELAADEQIMDLVASEWRSSSDTDSLAEEVAKYNEGVRAVLDCTFADPAGQNDVGSNVYIDARQANAWVKANRPDLGR